VPQSTKKEYKLTTGETLEEVYNIFEKYFSSVIQLDSNSKLIAPNLNVDNLTLDPTSEFEYIQLNTSLENAPTTVGAVYWDDQDKTITAVMEPSNGGSVKLQIGQEMYVRAVNKTGTTISNGEVVFISGAQGNRPTVELADSGSYENATKIIGVATEDIGNNLYGYVTTEGLVRDLNTDDYTEGDCVFVGTVSGSFTTVTPSFGDAKVKVGIITKSHPTDGWLKVCVANDKYIFGAPDDGNYSGFEEDGTLVAIGEAITWRDEYVASEYFVPSGASAPDIVNITVGGVTTKKYAFDGKTTAEKLGSNHEIQHDIAVEWVNNGTLSIEQHIHCCATTTASGTATFVTNWCLLKANAGIITGSNITASIYFDGTQTPYCNALIGDDLVTPAEGFGIGDLIEFTITRDPALASDTYEDDVVFYKSALHVPVDTFGSRQRYVK